PVANQGWAPTEPDATDAAPACAPVLDCTDPTCGDDEMPRPGELMAPRRHRRQIVIYSLASRRQVLTLSEQAGEVTV
ncbi:MAG TPA: hypothetical protein PLU22_21995, partial [Polyangiaceae bacterium]|nr:hypothetical protein [Polyangiaceae bacterium]